MSARSARSAAILIIDGLHYLNLSAVKFNHNIVEMPLWALAGFAFHAGLRQGKLRHWILLGAALGLAWWAKYFVVILATPLALFLLLDPQARRRLASPGPWIAAIVTLVVVAPNLYWLVQHGSQPFGYAQARAAAPGGALDHLVHPAEFVGGQIVRAHSGAADRGAVVLAAAESGAARAPRRLRSPHRHAAGLWAGAHVVRVLADHRPRHQRDVGLSVVAVPRPLDRRVRAGGARPRTLCPHRRLMGDRVCEFCHRLRRRLSGVAALRSSLSRGLLSRRSSVRGDHAAFRSGDREGAGLHHRLDVGRRQRRALFDASARSRAC